METSISLARRRSRTRPEQPLTRILALRGIARRSALDSATAHRRLAAFQPGPELWRCIAAAWQSWQSRDEYGVWMSGQATVRVLKALLPVALRQLQGPETGNFALTVNGKPLSQELASALKVDGKLLDAPRSIDLSAMIHGGTNTLEFEGTTDATFANAQITAWFYVPWAQNAGGKTETTIPGKSFGLDFGYTCDAANATVGQAINCTVSARRFGSQATA